MNDMKILVTGGLGFIGSNFIIHILEKYPDFEIVNIDACLHGSNPKNLPRFKNQNYSYVKGNITDKKLVEKLISKSDIVVNFAAESHVDRSISDPKPFIDSNIIGVYTILESIRKHKKRMIHISTDEVFGSLKLDSANEKFPFNPSSPYAASKASAEMLVKSYVTTYDCNCVITRCTNNYGPRQFPEKLIPKTILLADQNKKIPIYGNGTNIRDWIFVEDHCNAIFNILTNGKLGESYNISASNEMDNITIVKKILSLMNKSEDLIKFVEDRPGHDFRYSMDSQKTKKELNWQTKVNFEEGIKKTVDWYLSNREWWKTIMKNSLNQTPWKI
jgi:dTDP-glucose 4,6-dehydratase